jgi:3'(2'), 5'-bisphosphate nucleotidase
MAVFAEGATVDRKADDSPVTEADRRAEEVILAGAAQAYPAIPCVAEEEVSSGGYRRRLDDEFFLVDPLDGTKEFIARRPDFTVNIALIRRGVPVIGVVYAPAQGALYSGRPGMASEAKCVDAGHVAGERRAISVRVRAESVRVVASRSHARPRPTNSSPNFPEPKSFRSDRR